MINFSCIYMVISDCPRTLALCRSVRCLLFHRLALTTWSVSARVMHCILNSDMHGVEVCSCMLLITVFADSMTCSRWQRCPWLPWSEQGHSDTHWISHYTDRTSSVSLMLLWLECRCFCVAVIPVILFPPVLWQLSDCRSVPVFVSLCLHSSRALHSTSLLTSRS